LELSLSIHWAILLSAIYVGFNIGANDAANCIGGCVGGGALPFRRAVVLGAASAFAGGLLGGRVSETISSRILSTARFEPSLAVTVLVVSGILVTVSTIAGIPVSTSNTMVMALVGVGLALGIRIHSANVGLIVLAWSILPFVMIALSNTILRGLMILLRRVGSLVQLEIIFKYMLIASAAYASFALGASHSGLVGGMLQGTRVAGPFAATVIGSVSIAAGILLMSGRVVRTVGSGITDLSPTSAFGMQVSSAVGLTVCSAIGLPVSSSQAIVSSAVGIGLSRRGAGVNRRQLEKIVAFWILVPSAAMVLAFVSALMLIR